MCNIIFKISILEIIIILETMLLYKLKDWRYLQILKLKSNLH